MIIVLIVLNVFPYKGNSMLGGDDKNVKHKESQIEMLMVSNNANCILSNKFINMVHG